ncbi:MAG: hypothetical protein ACK4S4_08720 [Pyrinomonadaceae bacterium]
MIFRLATIGAVSALLGLAALAQTPTVESTQGRSRVVVVTDNTPVKPTSTATKPILESEPRLSPTPERAAGPTQAPVATQPLSSVPRPLLETAAAPRVDMSFIEIKSKIADAKRQLQTRPEATAMTDSPAGHNWVKIAFLDPKTEKIDFVTITKTSFLVTGQVTTAISEGGRTVTQRTIRANGVNTPVQIFDITGQPLLPLMVQYPVERGGRYYETAYYMSTHPGLVTSDVVAAGKLYVRNVIEIARDRLRAKGISISPKIADRAERLATVEHVDHQRFRTEPHQVIYDDIFTLYALNEGQTYRYSVSSAGAGGMVQMIPSTYSMVRSWHPNVGLMPDFVEGMRNHVNAAQAMLLYMNRTWNDLVASPTISAALASGIATPEQLMAAGYNSNPARLAGYISRGGANWTSLIPRETQIYLQIYSSLERFVPMSPRTR